MNTLKKRRLLAYRLIDQRFHASYFTRQTRHIQISINLGAQKFMGNIQSRHNRNSLDTHHFTLISDFLHPPI